MVIWCRSFIHTSCNSSSFAMLLITIPFSPSMSLPSNHFSDSTASKVEIPPHPSHMKEVMRFALTLSSQLCSTQLCTMPVVDTLTIVLPSHGCMVLADPIPKNLCKWWISPRYHVVFRASVESLMSELSLMGDHSALDIFVQASWKMLNIPNLL